MATFEYHVLSLLQHKNLILCITLDDKRRGMLIKSIGAYTTFITVSWFSINAIIAIAKRGGTGSGSVNTRSGWRYITTKHHVTYFTCFHSIFASKTVFIWISFVIGGRIYAVVAIKTIWINVLFIIGLILTWIGYFTRGDCKFGIWWGIAPGMRWCWGSRWARRPFLVCADFFLNSQNHPMQFTLVLWGHSEKIEDCSSDQVSLLLITC